MFSTEARMLLLLVGCLLGEKSDTADTVDTGPTDTDATDTGLPSGEAYGCVEIARETLVVTSEPAEGMTFSPDEAAAAWSGTWAGDFRFASGETQPASFVAAADGAWELVARELYDGGGMAEGAPSEECGPYYAWATTASLTEASGALAETFPVDVAVFELDRASLYGGVALDSVVGTTRPTAWDPAEWARNALAVSGEAAPGEWTVSVMWQASSGAEAKDEGVPTDSGVVEPSGMTELVGSGAFIRAE